MLVVWARIELERVEGVLKQYPRALGRLGLGSGSPISPLIIIFVSKELGFSATSKCFPRGCGGKSPCWLIMNFDLRAVPGGCSAHALRTCILCLHNGLLHMYIACCCIVYACQHAVCAYVMLAFCACMLVCCACTMIYCACMLAWSVQ